MLQRAPGRRALAFGLAAAIGVVTVSAAGAATPGKLVVNGDAEADVGADSDDQIVKPAGWHTAGEFTVVQYGARNGFPDASAPGPADRGKNMFAGGSQSISTATQTIDLTAEAAAIVGGKAQYDLSAWLGGYDGDEDTAEVRLVFLNGARTPIGNAVAVGPVTRHDRRSVTGLLRREVTGPVPAAAHAARLTITCIRQGGIYNAAFVDDVSLTVQ